MQPKERQRFARKIHPSFTGDAHPMTSCSNPTVSCYSARIFALISSIECNGLGLWKYQVKLILLACFDKDLFSFCFFSKD